MPSNIPSFPPDLSHLARNEWLSNLRGIGEERGFAEPLGKAHAAIFVEDGDTLLVSFETTPGIEALSTTRTPLGFDMVGSHGWSVLTVLAHADTWYRDERVFSFFDHLMDDSFFDEFDKVIFYSAGPCGLFRNRSGIAGSAAATSGHTGSARHRMGRPLYRTAPPRFHLALRFRP